MSIWAYVGLPRQGKSYNAVLEQIIPALRRGRRVVTNIQLVPEAIAKFLGVEVSSLGEIVQLTNEDLAKDKASATLKRIRGGDLVAFDEMWRYLPKGLQAKDLPEEWTALFAEHGHMVGETGDMTQLIFVVQDLGNIAAFARSLVERTVVITKLEMIGKANSFRVDTYAGNVTGLKPPKAARISEEFGTYDKRIFECYVSRTKSEAGEGVKVNEKGMSSRGSVLRNPAVKFGLPIAAALIGFGLWRAWLFFFPEPERQAPGAAVASVAPASRSEAESRIVRPAGVARANAGRLRISAVIRRESDIESRVLLDTCDGAPSRWVRWFSARCVDEIEGGVSCEWRGQRYEFSAAIRECRQADEPRSAEIRWFPADDSGSRESVSVVGSALDGASRASGVSAVRDGAGSGAAG